MLHELDEAQLDAKYELLHRARAVAQQGPRNDALTGEELGAFLYRFYRHVPAEDLLERDPLDVYGAAVAHYSLALSRPPGRPAVRVYTPTVEEHGWSSGHSVIEIVIDDMPFLVDSVTSALTQWQLPIHVVIHPLIPVRRALTGELREICEIDPEAGPDADAALPADVVRESWMHIEVDRISDRDRLAEIQDELFKILGHVRDVVEDWQKMREAALAIADSLGAEPVPDREQVGEAQEFLRWLADDHFTFVGYREYELATASDDDGAERMELRAVPGTGLGISRPDKLVSATFAQASPEVQAKMRDGQLLTVSKAMDKSTVHRASYLDYVGIKRYDQDGHTIGERRFLGLLTSDSFTQSITQIPIIKRKVGEVFHRSGLDYDSHDGRDLLEVLETYPREELFQISPVDLTAISTSVLHLAERRRLRLYLRRDDYGRFLSALVYLPRDRYNTQIRLAMQQILLTELGGSTIDYTLRSTESALARLHFVVRMAPGEELPADLDDQRIEALLSTATRQWEDDFLDALIAQCGEEQANLLRERYAAAVPEGYKADFPARTAVADLIQVDALTAGGEVAMNLYEPLAIAAPGIRRFKIYKLGASLSLSALLPVLARMGVEVVDERPYEFRLDAATSAWVYDLGLRFDPALEPELEARRQLFQEAFAAVLRGDAESDGINQLVLTAGLGWRQAMMLRALVKYLRQAGTTFSQSYIEQCLVANSATVAMLVELFDARLNPARQADRAAVVDGLVERINAELDAVASLDEDRILRSLLRLVEATLRSNYYQHDTDGSIKPYVSFKFDPQAIPELPAPRPAYEIWVYSPRVEGVHLRFGKVARGGLRWSDRREDFRTEILGLVKAQTVKNAVIVPVGAKGGFVVKNPDLPDREALQAEAVACYTLFVRGMLDLTDNLRVQGGERVVQPPPEVVRHDGEDSYLVVAADKGTATFSDIANAIAGDYHYWLGDAFASGGCTGYDHKVMGITARGAWESVKRHFRELGIDTQSQPFTCVGIGDMSGDVFGNGMLLSERIRLVAAFDHRHIFLDPDPDPATSYAERSRLFQLDRSSWGDYDRALISAGGGVYPRSAKAIPITDPVRRALGIATPDSASMTPAELLRAILAAPVDLLFNGGIGTYVKASAETNLEVGDKANDAVRINGDQVRARVVGEGGNLGFTQRGRIEYAMAGGRINTDAIDNSAGVDTSDHEVNIKILLDSVVAQGDLTTKHRNQLLEQMTDEVAELVLRDNYDQNVALATAQAQATSLVDVHQRQIRQLERDGKLDRRLEYLPRDKEFAERRQAGVGLSQPELAVLLAYHKITMTEELLSSELPDDDDLRALLYDYFPTPLRERFREEIDRHPLRREIITTCLVNHYVNRTGITSLFRLKEETGATAADVARAHVIAHTVYGVSQLRSAIAALDNQVAAVTQVRIRLEVRRLVERASRWLLLNRRPPLDISEQIRTYGNGVADVVAHLPKLVKGSDLRRMEHTHDTLVEAGVGDDLATMAAGMPLAYSALDVCEVARNIGRDVIEVAEVYFDLADRVGIAALLDRIGALPRSDRWSSLARTALRDDLYRAQAALASDILRCGGADDTPEQRFTQWVERNHQVLERTGQTMEELESSDSWDLATLSVAVRVVKNLSRHSRLT